MAKHVQIGTRKEARTVARKAMAGRSAYVMKPEYLELIENSEEGRRTMCKAMEKIKAEGKRENMLATAKRLLANGKLVLKEIAQCTGLSLAQVKKLQASMA